MKYTFNLVLWSLVLISCQSKTSVASIQFLQNNNFTTLQDIISQNQFEDKLVLVDFWFSSCVSCIEDFQHLPELKAELKKLPVEYLYLSNDKGTRRIAAWEKKIQEYNLTGHHICLQDSLLINVWNTVRDNTVIYNDKGKPYPKNVQVYPHYLIVDKDGSIVDYDAPNPDSDGKLIESIKSYL